MTGDLAWLIFPVFFVALFEPLKVFLFPQKPASFFGTSESLKHSFRIIVGHRDADVNLHQSHGYNLHTLYSVHLYTQYTQNLCALQRAHSIRSAYLELLGFL